MDYLWWHVPILTAPMLIAFIATVHVFVSHYAVGGGLFLAAETTWAHKTENRQYLDYLKSHAKFFVLLTVVFGAITGVGIWWVIGLASPLATETLIRTFVFGWAAEWVFFVVELTAAYLFLSLWDRVTPRDHCTLGWLYAGASVGTLILITGITAFMLDAGKWPEATQAGMNGSAFWLGFFNPQFLPQCVARIGVALMMASTWVLFHASIFVKSEELKFLIVRRTARYVAAGVVLSAIGILWAGAILPEAAKLSLMRAAALNVILGAGVIAAGFLLFQLFILTARPQWLTPASGLAVLCAAMGILTSGEFIREAVRKPFILPECIYGNQVHVSKVEMLRQNGLLESGVWTKPYVTEKFPHHVDAQTGKLVLEQARPEDEKALGEIIFMHHCGGCHAQEFGYSGLGFLSTTSEKGEIAEMLPRLNSQIYSMPPWCGTAKEADLLAVYLESIAKPHPFQKSGSQKSAPQETETQKGAAHAAN